MNEISKSIPVATVVTYALWAIVGLGLGLGWSLMLGGHHEWAAMFGTTAAVMSGIASLFVARCYALRTWALMRTLHGLDPSPDRRDLHRVP